MRWCCHNNEKYFSVLGGFQHVTCKSVLKLIHKKSNVRLHSHDVKYGSGSGQQVKVIVTLLLLK